MVLVNLIIYWMVLIVNDDSDITLLEVVMLVFAVDVGKTAGVNYLVDNSFISSFVVSVCLFVNTGIRILFSRVVNLFLVSTMCVISFVF